MESLIESIKSVVAEATDEVASEHVEELILQVAEEAIANHYGLIDSDDDLDDEEEPIDFYSDMDSFSSDE